METVEESAVLVSSYENVGESPSKDELTSCATDEVQLSLKTNGISTETHSEPDHSSNGETKSIEISCVAEAPQKEVVANNLVQSPIMKSSENNETTIVNTELPTEILENKQDEQLNLHDDSKAVECITNSSLENVSFETEVVVEKEGSEEACDSKNNVSNTLLSELSGQQIELNAALISSAENETIENNNSSKPEVLNNEELLDILEGNDQMITNHETTKLALEQLSQLNSSKRKSAKGSAKKKVPLQNESIHFVKSAQKPNKKHKNSVVNSKNEDSVTQENEKEHIVTALFKDWDDDEMDEEANKEKDNDEKSTDDKSTVEKSAENENMEIIDQNSTLKEESKSLDNEESTKVVDESLPQRRLGRVIKKKVIFDPDNPDTFTKSKSTSKSKEIESVSPEKEQSATKRPKPDQTLRDNSKSPIGKAQWKKPTPKPNKNFKRLSEVDRLLMDEGAVNMIYQLTPEASKGKKNMRTKAELIKKINQSSTPDQKEMKFRERKKETKSEESEAKKITGGKHRSSGSVKSSACEDFDTHSADDSIIYRRHSSSSYSSACMSPRRLSEIDVAQNVSITTQEIDYIEIPVDTTEQLQTDVFMTVEPVNIIKKEDCLSLKEKLNSKLSNILNKRKRESPKTEKPTKQKRRLVKPETQHKITTQLQYETLLLCYENQVANIRWKKSISSHKYITTQMMKDLQNVLEVIDRSSDTSVTLINLEPEEIFSSGVDLHPLLEENINKRTTYALELTSAVRGLLISMRQHHKLLIGAVSGRTDGVSLALLMLCDVTVASDNATFAFTNNSLAAMMPGVSILTSNYRQLHRNLVTNMVLFDRRLSAAEACREGLVTRVFYPHGFSDQVLDMAKDIASKPVESVLIKKHLLNIKRECESETAAFQSALSAEQDLFVEYWTSVSGQELLRSLLST